MNKTDLIQKLKTLEGLTAAEKADLINLVNTNKKYGLVWEDKPEEVEEQLRQHLPVLQEVVEKRILAAPTASPTPTNEGLKAAAAAKPSLFAAEEAALQNQPESKNPINPTNPSAPNHILIEGDNLHALTALSFTHEGKIDVIYIDPPYNTGNKDFKYNDSFVDKEDSYRHSKWLSFMDKRLRIAKKLLSEKGVIFISIDDNEQAQLKLLCDEIFGIGNFVAAVPRVTKASGKTTDKIALNHDYLCVVCKNKSLSEITGIEHFDKGFKHKDAHFEQRGFYKLNQTLDYDTLQYSKSLDYEIELDGVKLYPGTSYEKYLERKEGIYNRADWAWRWRRKLFEFGLKNDFIVLKKSRNGHRIYTKTYLKANIEEDSSGNYYVELFTRSKPLTSLEFVDPSYSNDNAKKDLKRIIPQTKFDYPKPLAIIDTILKSNPNTSLTILDFFAGSGTTLHATMQLNAEDGGSRQCILVTNNENNICEEVTYERNRRVIQGYTNGKGLRVEGLGNNTLRYYQSLFVPANKSEANKRLLTNTSTDLLCIKEDCYDDITEAQGFNSKQCRIFTNATGQYLLVIYHSRQLAVTCEALIAWILALPPTPTPIKLYVFSPEKDTLAEDFAEVAHLIEAVPLPEAIYNAYRATFKTLKIDRQLITPEQVAANTEPELFDGEEG